MSSAPLHLLCIEPRFPGRLGAAADWLVRHRGYRCWFYCAGADEKEHWPESVGKGLDVVHFGVGGVAREPSVGWMRALERSLCYTYGALEALEARRPRPIDLILGRSAGLGSTLFAPVSLPRVPMVNLFEYFYDTNANDLMGDCLKAAPENYRHWRRSANAVDLLDLENGVTHWVPTRWQADLYPPEYRSSFLILHDGVDSFRFQRRSATPRKIGDRVVPDDARVVSFVARSLDRVRGFDRFARLADKLAAVDPRLLFVVAGDPIARHALDVEFYGRDFAAHTLDRVPAAVRDRFWLLGVVPPAVVADVFAVTDLHIYSSRAYPVSRSLVEALCSGCMVVAWDTEPVREFITPGRTGLLVSANDPRSGTDEALRVLRDPGKHRPLGEAAALLVRQQYAQDVTLPRLAEQFDRLVQRKA